MASRLYMDTPYFHSYGYHPILIVVLIYMTLLFSCYQSTAKNHIYSTLRVKYIAMNATIEINLYSE